MTDAAPTATLPTIEQYHGVPSSQIRPVFKTALARRFSRPDAGTIIDMTSTSLDMDIVSAILEGALRTLPADISPDGLTQRKEEMALKAAHASSAEALFVTSVRRLFPILLDERQQQEQIKVALAQGRADVIKSTPDILFDKPTELCGLSCHWVEYKNTFGFKSNPFLQQKHKKQMRRYIATFGAGMVVYKLGFERDLFSIDGLWCFREREVIQWIDGAVLEEGRRGTSKSTLVSSG